MSERQRYTGYPSSMPLSPRDEVIRKELLDYPSIDSLINASRLRQASQGQVLEHLHPSETLAGDYYDTLVEAGLAAQLMNNTNTSPSLQGDMARFTAAFANTPDEAFTKYGKNSPRENRPFVNENLTREDVLKKIDSLIGEIDMLAENFYEGTAEVYKLKNIPTVMFKPRDESPHTALDLVARLKDQGFMVFYTDGTIVSLPPDEEALEKVLDETWSMFYIGIGLPKGFNQGTAEEDSSGVIRSSDPTGKDKRVYSDVGYSAAVAARRGLGRDMELRRDDAGTEKPVFFGFSMADKDLPVPENTDEEPVVKRKNHNYIGRRIVPGSMKEAFAGMTKEYFNQVRDRIDYPLSLDKLQWRDISGFAECIVDTIDSTDDIYKKSVLETEYRLRVTMALFRSFQTISEEFWHYLYDEAYEAKHPNPEARKNPIGYQIYGESIKLQFEDLPEVMIGTEKASKFLDEFIERAVQRMDKILRSVTEKRLQPSLLRHPDYDYHFNGSDSTDHSYEGLMAKIEEYVMKKIRSGERVTPEEYRDIIEDVLRKTTFMYNGYIQSSPHIDDDYEAAAAALCKEIISLNEKYGGGVDDPNFSRDVYLITDRFFALVAPRR